MYASRRRAPLMIRRSPRRVEITARAKSHLSQRSNPNSWQRLPHWRLTDRAVERPHPCGRYAGILPAFRETEGGRVRATFFLYTVLSERRAVGTRFGTNLHVRSHCYRSGFRLNEERPPTLIAISTRPGMM